MEGGETFQFPIQETPMSKTKIALLAALVAGLVLVASPLLQHSRAQTLRIPGALGFSGPFPEDIRSFYVLLTDTSPSSVLISSSGGHKPGFVITDITLDANSQTGDELLLARLIQNGASSSILGQVNVTLLLADSGTTNSTASGILACGSRTLHFESGIVVDTSPGSSLSISKFTGSGVINALVSGYFFEP